MVGTKTERILALVMVQTMLLSILAGCTGALDTTVDPRATLEAYPTLIQEGEMVTLDARLLSCGRGHHELPVGLW